MLRDEGRKAGKARFLYAIIRALSFAPSEGGRTIRVLSRVTEFDICINRTSLWLLC